MVEAKLDATLPHRPYCAVVCKAYLHSYLHKANKLDAILPHKMPKAALKQEAADTTQSLYMDADAQMVRSRLRGCVAWEGCKACCMVCCVLPSACMLHCRICVACLEYGTCVAAEARGLA